MYIAGPQNFTVDIVVWRVLSEETCTGHRLARPPERLVPFLEQFAVCSTSNTLTVRSPVRPCESPTRPCPCTCQILCAHVGTVVFFLATKFEAASAATNNSRAAASVEPQSIRSSTATAISGAAVAVHALLMEQRGRLTVVLRPPRYDEKCEPVWKGTHGSNDTEEGDATPVDVVVRSKYSVGRNEARRDSRNAGTSKILPIHEDIVALCGGEDSVCSVGQEEWTVESVSNVER